MAKNLIEFNAYTADVVDYTSYDSTKTVLGPDIYKFSGATPIDYYIGPNEIGFRDLVQDTGVFNWGDIDAITYDVNKQWLFCLKGFSTTSVTSDIALYEFDKTDYSYTYKGEIRASGSDGTSVVHQGIKAHLDYYSTGTVEVNGTSVTGSGTNWIDGRIPIGARIGFGSTNPASITNWYRITDYPLMNSLPSKINNTVYCITVDPATDKIYMGGTFTVYDGVTQSRILRLNSDGTLDTTFNSGAGFNGTVTVITLDSAGKIYVGGFFTTYDGVAANRIIKLNADGTKDTSFDNSTGFSNVLYDITLDSAGQIWVAGAFTTYKGVSAPYLTKLNTDGSRDGTYPNTINPNTSVYTIAVDANDDVYVGGAFTQVGTTANNSRYIAKVLKTGGLDPTFVVGTAGISNGFNGQVYTLHYKSATNTIVVGGTFTAWTALGNTYLTELSATGSIIIASASNIQILGIKADNLGNIYCYSVSFLLTTKRDINTLSTISAFNPNIITASSPSLGNSLIAMNAAGDRIYVASGNSTADSGIVCVDAATGKKDINFYTSQDYVSQAITIDSTAGVLPPGTPYVIEDLKIYFARGGAVQMLQGISIDDFTTTSVTSLAAPAYNFMGLAKGRYNILDGNYQINGTGFNNATNNGSFKDVRIINQEGPSTHYLYAVTNNGAISRFNVKADYITQLGTGTTGQLRFTTLDQIIASGNGLRNDTGGNTTGYASGKFTIGTMQSGSAAGIKSIYLDFSGVIQLPLSSIENGIRPIYNYMAEQPPGSSTTYAAAGNVGRVYFVPEIDRLVILNTSATAKSYITKFDYKLQQPTLSTSIFDRNTYNQLAIDNSYDLAFLVNGNQLQSAFSNPIAPKYPDTLGSGFFGAVENGVFHLCRPINSIQNTLYALPIACEAEYVNQSNNVFITPKYILPNAISISGLYVNTQKEYGEFPFNFPPEPIVIDYRTEGIDDNSGAWKRFTTINDLNSEIICEGVLNNVAIQFRFAYKIAGTMCLTNKIYGFSLVYEDDRTDSNYSPSITKSNLANRTFAWRQDKPWYGNIPDLKIRLYNANNNKIVYYDSVTASDSGTWEYSIDGINWLPWDVTADNVGNYIRYVADFIPNGIKLRVGLNRI